MRLAGPVDLDATLHGGQAFRWTREEDGAHVGVVGRRVARYRSVGSGVEATASPRAGARWHARFLGATAEDDAARERLRADPALAPAIRAHPGLRILRQEPWEATAAFVASANNNVLRIAGIVRGLAQRHGEALDSPWGERRAFPGPDVVARLSEARLRALGLGYRAPFLRETARRVASGEVDLDALVGAPLGEIREALLPLPGVGPKVADCIALFALEAGDAFPIDRWVARAVSEAFFAGCEVKPREAEAFARARWGRDAGLAQQFLFHAIRMRKAKSRPRDAAAWTRSSP